MVHLKQLSILSLDKPLAKTLRMRENRCLYFLMRDRVYAILPFLYAENRIAYK